MHAVEVDVQCEHSKQLFQGQKVHDHLPRLIDFAVILFLVIVVERTVQMQPLQIRHLGQNVAVQLQALPRSQHLQVRCLGQLLTSDLELNMLNRLPIGQLIDRKVVAAERPQFGRVHCQLTGLSVSVIDSGDSNQPGASQTDGPVFFQL